MTLHLYFRNLDGSLTWAGWFILVSVALVWFVWGLSASVATGWMLSRFNLAHSGRANALLRVAGLVSCAVGITVGALVLLSTPGKLY
jgi:hypothetical protein